MGSVEQRDTTDHRIAWPDSVSRLAAAGVIALGALVLIGWQYDLESLKRVLPSLVAMNPATAITFSMAGLSLWLLSPRQPAPLRRRIAYGLACLVALIGLLKLLAYLGGWDMVLDRLLFADRLNLGGPITAHGTSVPNRMAPNTAMLFALTGTALALLCWQAPRARLAGKLLAMFVALLAMVAIIGYLSDVTSLYRPTAYIPIALHTAGAFLVFAIGVIMLGVRRVGDAASDRRLIRMVENNITAGFGAAMFLVAVIGIVSYASIRDFATDSRRNEHTQQVMAVIAELALHTREVDAAVLGFVITGDEAFLDPHRGSLGQVSPRHAQLLMLTEDNPVQQRQLAALTPLLEHHGTLLQQAVNVRRHEGFATAQQMVTSRLAKQTTDQIRAILREMRAHEEGLLAMRSQSTANSALAAVGIIIIGSLLAFALVICSSWLIRKDIAMRRATEAELRRTRDAAEAANRAKSQFLANMSHEIRTPMTAIIGYADLLLDARQSHSDRLNHVNTIRRNGEHLLTLVNDILDLSKIEAGKALVERVPCSPCRIISDVTSLMRVRATEKELRFEVTMQGPLPETIQTDPTRLRQILINLVGNAIKFTDAGWVRLNVKVEPNDAGRPMLRFDVIDTGIGMTREQVSSLFHPFRQADCSTTRRFGGTGLGLSICKPLTEKLGGRIEVDSTPDRGSTFTIWIDPGPLEGVPLTDICMEAVEADDLTEHAQAMPTLRARLLLVEDGLDNRQLLSIYLREAGAHVSLAENGQIGCEKALAALADDNPFDLVLMDMQMPVLDGYGATARLRAKGYEGPIIALTAHAMPEDRIKCLQVGCTDYLTKPIRRSELVRSLARHLKQDGCTANTAACARHAQHTGAERGSATVQPPIAAETIRPDAMDESVQPYVEAFIHRLPEQAAQLQVLLEQQDLAALAQLVHKLKGAGGLYGLMPITDAAARAEARIDASNSPTAVADAVSAMIALMRRVEGYDPQREVAPRRPVA